MPGVGHSNPRSDVISHPLPAAIGLNAAEEVKAQLRPIVDSLRDFQRLMFGVVRRQHAILYRLAAFRGEDRVNLHHGGAGGDGIVAINLNFVVILGARAGG